MYLGLTLGLLITAGLGVIIGAVTFYWFKLIAAGELQGVIPGKPNCFAWSEEPD